MPQPTEWISLCFRSARPPYGDHSIAARRVKIPANGPCDWRADAVENAARLGLTIVVSAGNDGDIATQYPGYNSSSYPRIGSLRDYCRRYDELTSPLSKRADSRRQRLPTLFGNGPLPSSPLTAPLKDVSKLQDNGRACSPLTNGSLSGSIALIERGDCALHLKVLYAQRAGASGSSFTRDANIQGVFKMDTLQETGIPAVLVGNTSGTTLKNYAANTPNGNVTLDPAIYETADERVRYDRVLLLSRPLDPRKRHQAGIGRGRYRPVLATQKFDPNGDMYDPSGYTTAQGTSFAAPFVAGAAALVKQRNPQWNAAQIKSAVVNTATAVIQDYDQNGNRIQASVLDIGAGKLNADAAVPYECNDRARNSLLRSVHIYSAVTNFANPQFFQQFRVAYPAGARELRAADASHTRPQEHRSSCGW